MNELEAKKRLLAAESEVYRELLKLEIQNFRIYGKRTQRKLGLFQTYVPMLMSSLPVAATLFSRKSRFTFRRLGSLVFMGWRAYNRFGPMLRSRKRARVDHTAAEEYLAKRI